MRKQIKPRYKLIVILLYVSSLYACSTTKQLQHQIKKEFKNSELINKYQVGFALYDPVKQAMVYEKDADKYYTPASNTKLFTFFAGLKIAPDSIPSLRYIIKGDSLIFWGTGDPSLLHSQLKGHKALDFLKNSSKKLYFSPNRYTGDFFGYGWSWDDYNDYYQAEINELPLYDNLFSISKNNESETNFSPLLLADYLETDSLNTTDRFNIKRDFLSNKFILSGKEIPKNYRQQIPYKTSTDLTIKLLNDTLKKVVQLVQYPFTNQSKTIYSTRSEDVFREMMLPSDNFIAEQLLLTYADRMNIEMNTTKVIQAIKDKYLNDLPDSPKWLDGSGLSRSNLFTPRSIIKLLDLIYHEVSNQKRLFGMLPAGGKSGTLKNAYPKTEKPFVYGKTGTLGGVHNQSGYLLTQKGKLLYFSFMNNNFVQTTSEVRKEMVRILTTIHERF